VLSETKLEGLQDKSGVAYTNNSIKNFRNYLGGSSLRNDAVLAKVSDELEKMQRNFEIQNQYDNSHTRLKIKSDFDLRQTERTPENLLKKILPLSGIEDIGPCPKDADREASAKWQNDVLNCLSDLGKHIVETELPK
jgi:hypothetical protein